MNKEKSSLKENLTIAFVVPLIILAIGEIFARITDLPKLIKQKDSSFITLEMPTWLKQEENSRINVTSKKLSKQQIDWLSIFEEGDGFRVHLKPNISKYVTNTFSMIPYDLENKYLIQANSLGFRDNDHQLQSSLFKVAIFGDSSSFGWGVSQQYIFSQILEEKLKRNFPTMHPVVLNFAMPGDSSEYGKLIFLKFYKKIKADFVILGFGANDAKKVFFPHNTQVKNFKQNKMLLNIKRTLEKSYLFKSFSLLLEQLASSFDYAKKLPKKRKPAVHPSHYRLNLLQMADYASVAGAKNVLFLTLCTPLKYAKKAKRAAKNYHLLFFDGERFLKSKIKEIQRGKLYPSLLKEMQDNYGESLKQNSLFYITSDMCHPNKIANQLIADELYKIIAPYIAQKQKIVIE